MAADNTVTMAADNKSLWQQIIQSLCQLIIVTMAADNTVTTSADNTVTMAADNRSLRQLIIQSLWQQIISHYGSR